MQNLTSYSSMSQTSANVIPQTPSIAQGNASINQSARFNIVMPDFLSSPTSKLVAKVTVGLAVTLGVIGFAVWWFRKGNDEFVMFPQNTKLPSNDASSSSAPTSLKPSDKNINHINEICRDIEELSHADIEFGVYSRSYNKLEVLILIVKLLSIYEPSEKAIQTINKVVTNIYGIYLQDVEKECFTDEVIFALIYLACNNPKFIPIIQTLGVNRKDIIGYTPLALSVDHYKHSKNESVKTAERRLQRIKLLIDAGADPTMKVSQSNLDQIDLTKLKKQCIELSNITKQYLQAHEQAFFSNIVNICDYKFSYVNFFLKKEEKSIIDLAPSEDTELHQVLTSRLLKT